MLNRGKDFEKLGKLFCSRSEFEGLHGQFSSLHLFRLGDLRSAAVYLHQPHYMRLSYKLRVNHAVETSSAIDWLETLQFA